MSRKVVDVYSGDPFEYLGGLSVGDPMGTLFEPTVIKALVALNDRVRALEKEKASV